MILNLSVLWVIFVLLLTVILDRLLFRPLLRTIAQREAAIRLGARVGGAFGE